MELQANIHAYFHDFVGFDISKIMLYNHSYSKDEPDSRINDVV